MRNFEKAKPAKGLNSRNLLKKQSKDKPDENKIKSEHKLPHNFPEKGSVSSKKGKKAESKNLEEDFNLRRTQSDSKNWQGRAVKYERISEKLTSIEEKIEELKSLLKKKKKETNQRRQLREKILQRRQYESSSQPKTTFESVSRPEGFLSAVKKKTTKSIKNQLGEFITQAPRSERKSFKFNPYQTRDLYYVSEVLKGFKDNESLVRQHLENSIDFIKGFYQVKKPSANIIEKKILKLPKRIGYENKKTIVFDLDETLIHCNETDEEPTDVVLPIEFPTGDIVQARISVRPGAQDALRELCEDFELIVFTASHYCYGNAVIDYLDPNKELIHHRLFRQHCCLLKNGPYVKDLRILGRDLSQTVLIDNAAYSYIFQLQNGIPIIPYYSGEQDYEMKALVQYIKGLAYVDDVRTINRETFKLQKYFKFEECEQLVEQLYLNKK